MAKLLVSVRSPAEARDAVAGGAAIIDVKEPDRGPLGRSDASVWRAVRRAVPPEISISVALGELAEWREQTAPRIGGRDFEGIAYRKIGMAGTASDWVDRWMNLRATLGAGPSWVAVIYADWTIAGAPAPGTILDIALALPECAGVLVDTWDKSRSTPFDESWVPALARIRGTGRFVTLAGGLDEAAIARLSPLAPDYFAVRSAACADCNRMGSIERARVTQLRKAIRDDAQPL